MRENELKAWVEGLIGESFQWKPVSGDAGFRNYFRVTRLKNEAPHTMIAADAPPGLEKNQEFSLVGQYLSDVGLPVPRIYHQDVNKGFFLLEDLGSRDLGSVLDEHTVSDLYQQSMGLILQMGVLDRPSFLESYSRKKLLDEMNLFPEWFLNRLAKEGDCAFDVSPWERKWEQLTDLLINSALAQPQNFVHRDFHSRNLLLSSERGLGMIDFQDAVWGPLTYDLVSLLKDCYLAWPREQVIEWALDFHYRWVKMQHLVSGVSAKEGDDGRGIGALDDTQVGDDSPADRVSAETFIQWFDWMGLQRHIKVMGIFARLWLRDSKPRYLADLPRVLDYIIEVCEIYDDLEPFLPLFDELKGVMNQNALRTLFHPYHH